MRPYDAITATTHHFLRVCAQMRKLDEQKTACSRKTLQASVGRNKRQQTNIKKKDKMPTLRKIKRAASRHTSQRFCSTFNFTQPHQKPTHLPISGRLTI